MNHDIIDTQRTYQASNYPAPIPSYIEDSQPNNGPGITYTLASYIQPAEINQAAWMSIIAGARALS